MRKENKEYLFDLLQERLSLLDERTEQDWEDSGDPNAEELAMLDQAKEYLIKIWN